MTSRLFQKYYFARPGFVDGTTEFHSLCRDTIRSGGEILEIGAGPENPTSRFLASLGPTTGVDVSEEVLGNRALRQAYVYDGGALPFPDGSFDACVSNFVLEHVADPQIHFREISRVLRPDGNYILRTPNLFHYVSLAARVTPNSLHGIANRLRGFAADAHEPWPTCYRCNTVSTLKTVAGQAGLDPVLIRMIEKEPSYGRSHKLLFYPMMAYERCVNRFRMLSVLRCNILAVLRKIH